MPAGHSLLIDARGLGTPIAYHRIAQVYADAETQAAPDARPADTQARLREALLDSVRHHLEADVPVGAFLSAGIDSGARQASAASARAQRYPLRDWRNFAQSPRCPKTTVSLNPR